MSKRKSNLTVKLIPPKDLEGIQKALIEDLVDYALETHTPQEIEAVLNYWGKNRSQ